MFSRLIWRADTFVFGIIVIYGMFVTAADSHKHKRAVTCDAKYREITEGHTACLEPSEHLIANFKGVSEADKQLIVNEHNRVRREVTPFARNMMLMTWDDEIANTAQRWAENCVFDHDDNYKRYAFGRFSLGQNLALRYENWTAAMKGWEDEKHDYNYNMDPNKPTDKVVGHYTQMVWATSSKVGCGFARCQNLNADYYVCNYGPGGNTYGEKPYEDGVKCAACPNSCNNGLCDCGGIVCLNGGELDWNTCTCTCKPGLTFFLAPTCGMNCGLNQEFSLCYKYLESNSNACEVYTNVPQECPHTCGWCPWVDFSPAVSTTKPTDEPKTSTSTSTSSAPTVKTERSTRSTDAPETTTKPTAGASVVTFSALITIVLVFTHILIFLGH